MRDEVVRVGLLGAGTVGSALLTLMSEETESLAERAGLHLKITRVGVSDLSKERQAKFAGQSVTDDLHSIVQDPEIDVIVELIGGVEPARELLLVALSNGKPVVTANKELLATSGSELYAAAKKARVDLLFEAAVGGAIPLVRPLRESLAGERLSRVMGIVNGTTNYMLTRMAEQGASYEDALREAQELGYAERDPTADVEGHDAASKAAILATLAFGVEAFGADVSREGITALRQDDVAHAKRLGFEVKLLAIAERVGRGSDGHNSQQSSAGRVSIRVHPAMIPQSHPLASVRGSHNAVFIEGAAVGEIMLYGRGAGGIPTAAAVLGDLIDAAHNIQNGTCSRMAVTHRVTLAPLSEQVSAFYISIDVVDQPGVLAAVAGVFGDHNVSIRSMEQVGLQDEARLVFLTHQATEADMAATLKGLEALPAVERVGALLRVLAEADHER